MEGKEYGVRWTEFDRKDRLVTKEKFFTTWQQRANFVEGRIRLGQLVEVVAWCDPTDTNEPIAQEEQ